MAVPSAAAAYKKKDGIITLTPDQSTVIWTPNSATTGPPALTLSISTITQLQQTPDSAAKVMLKIFVKTAEAPEPVPYLFHFNSPSDPRAEANAIKSLLSRLIADMKSNDPSLPRPSSGATTPAASGLGSGTPTPGPASSKASLVRLFDDDALKADIVLQQSLLKADRNLSQMYMEGRKTKPESMSDTSFNTHFWSAKINLLRAHAIQSSQRRGPYNVLAQIKPVLEHDENDPNLAPKLKVKVSEEQVRIILIQHPLVRRIYNENVPPLRKTEFWERFFLSKLFKTLRGERPSGQEMPDKVFDKYDDYEDITAFSSKILSQNVPHTINLEGNEENQGGFKSGNRKDQEMRPKSKNETRLIETLNSLSEKILANAVPADNDPETSTRVDDETYEELTLRDLQGDAEDNRIMLNIREQSRLFSSESDTATKTAAVFAGQNPSKVLKGVQGDLVRLAQDGAGGVNMHDSLGVDEASESEDDKGTRQPHVGSRGSRKEAQKQILESMLQRRAQLYGHGSDDSTPMGLPAEIAASCNLTHATAVEFLHQFWSAFLSGDPDRAGEVGYLAEALKKSRERVEVMAVEAEKVRAEQINKRKAEILQIYEKTKKKVKFNAKSVRGGREAVTKLMEPVVYCLDKALIGYQDALAAEGLQASTEQ
ncbi:RNA polymerase II transcription factor protein [Poronia punctata]|nr:RNA polymerase II transcription factor protein [Poronia punctata]